ncbi:MAG: methylmalonyl-CoA carboxyltransferase [Deltaproteobacteria bacterium]|nr:methylmalonyl-CoA carboxyltransferase [Deltaproteobacteria bacterium]
MATSKEKLALLQKESARLRKGGGDKAIEKQHSSGKRTARERLDLLFDAGTFQETGLFAKHRCTNFGMDQKDLPADGVVSGSGAVNGRLVFTASQDFTVVAGTAAEVHCRKFCQSIDEGMRFGAPVVLFEDSGGARIQEGVDSLNGYGEIFYRNTLASGVVPQIVVVAGPCAGGAVYSPALCDFVIMVKGTGQMFITGPKIIKEVMGEEVSMQDLGGAEVHAAKSGVAHFMAETEEEALEIVKKILSYLPSNNLEDPPRVRMASAPARPALELNTLVPDDPRTPYDMKKIIELVVDEGSFFEVSERFARNFIIGFARIAGMSVGIFANQPQDKAGCLDIDASDKAARHIRFCNAFNVPLVNFVDVPGFLPGVAQEHGGIIRHGAKMLHAYSAATVPKVTIIIKKAYGGSYLAMCCKALGADRVLAWPTAEIAVMGAEMAVPLIFRKDLKAADDPEARRKELLEEYKEKFSNPYRAAERLQVDEVIVPAETRKHVIRALDITKSKRETIPAKKNDNIPL